MGIISRKKNSVDATNERKIGKPPAEGIGTLLMRRSFGLSTIPVCTEMILNIGVNIKDNNIFIKFYWWFHFRIYYELRNGISIRLYCMGLFQYVFKY